MSALASWWIRPWQGALGALVAYVTGQIAGGAAAMPALFYLMFSGPPPTDEHALTSLFLAPGVYVPMLAATAAYQVAIPLGVVALARKDVWRGLGLHRVPLVPLLLAPIGMLALQPVSDLCVTVFARAFPRLTFGALDQLADLGRAGPFALMFLLMAVGPGVSEELIFRGLLQRSIERRWLAILVSALAFSFAHVDPHHVAGVLPIGFYLAWVAARSDSTWVTMAAHVVNNGVAVLSMRVDALNVGFGTDTPTPRWAVAAGLAVGALCIAGIAFSTRNTAPTRDLEPSP